MSAYILGSEYREKLLVLSSLWTTFAGAFLLVVSTNF